MLEDTVTLGPGGVGLGQQAGILRPVEKGGPGSLGSIPAVPYLQPSCSGRCFNVSAEDVINGWVICYLQQKSL